MTPELARSKALWRDLFALGSMNDAKRFLALIKRVIESGDLELKWPLWISFIVTYSRPFTSNDDIGRISPKAVPKDLKELHTSFTKARDLLYGHTDPLETLEDGFQANQIILRKIGDSCDVLPHTLVPHDDELPRAFRLVDALIADLEEWTKQGKAHLLSQVSGKPDGDYLFPYPNLRE